MIVAVIGQSGSGKTTFVKNRFLLGRPSCIRKDPDTGLSFTKAAGGVVLLGKYNIGKDCEGTDTLSFTSQPKIIQFLEARRSSVPFLVLEGDRITDERIFRYLSTCGTPVELFYLTCPIDLSIEARADRGGSVNTGFIQTTATKARTIYEKYSRIFKTTTITREQ